MSDLPQSALPQLVASLCGAVILGAFIGGLMVRIVGGWLHRPFWKIGARLAAAAVASLPILCGLELLAFATSFSLTGTDRVEALLFAALGVVAIGVGVVGVRCVMHYDIANAPWQRPEQPPGGDR